jgi:hypothetical protein
MKLFSAPSILVVKTIPGANMGDGFITDISSTVNPFYPISFRPLYIKYSWRVTISRER